MGQVRFFVVGRIGVVTMLVEPILQDANLDERHRCQVSDEGGRSCAHAIFGQVGSAFLQLRRVSHARRRRRTVEITVGVGLLHGLIALLLLLLWLLLLMMMMLVIRMNHD